MAEACDIEQSTPLPPQHPSPPDSVLRSRHCADVAREVRSSGQLHLIRAQADRLDGLTRS